MTVPLLAGVGAAVALSGGQEGDLAVTAPPATAPSVSAPPATAPAVSAPPATAPATTSPTEASSSPSPTAAYVVAEVTDGDTLDVVGSEGAITVRLAQVDAPELGECWFEESRSALTELAPPGTAVAVRRPGPPFTDRYGRTLGELVRGDGTSVSVALVARGAAAFDARFADEDPDLAARLRSAHERARATAAGLWGACGGPHEPAAAARQAP